MYVTDNYLNSFFDYMRFYAMPGTESMLYFKKNVFKRLQKPYNSCLAKRESYKKVNCIEICVQKLFATEMNCTSPNYYKNKLIQTECTQQDWSSRYHEFKDKCNLTCDQECDQATFDVSMVQKQHRNASVVRVIAFYSDLNYIEVSQIPKITVADMISSVGGTFGFFLGLSFLSFMEVLEFMIEIFSLYST